MFFGLCSKLPKTTIFGQCFLFARFCVLFEKTVFLWFTCSSRDSLTFDTCGFRLALGSKSLNFWTCSERIFLLSCHQIKCVLPDWNSPFPCLEFFEGNWRMKASNWNECRTISYFSCIWIKLTHIRNISIFVTDFISHEEQASNQLLRIACTCPSVIHGSLFPGSRLSGSVGSLLDSDFPAAGGGARDPDAAAVDEHQEYLRELERIRTEIAGFQPIEHPLERAARTLNGKTTSLNEEDPFTGEDYYWRMLGLMFSKSKLCKKKFLQ